MIRNSRFAWFDTWPNANGRKDHYINDTFVSRSYRFLMGSLPIRGERIALCAQVKNQININVLCDMHYNPVGCMEAKPSQPTFALFFVSNRCMFVIFVAISNTTLNDKMCNTLSVVIKTTTTATPMMMTTRTGIQNIIPKSRNYVVRYDKRRE